VPAEVIEDLFQVVHPRPAPGGSLTA
jgi:hypothetical protein